MRMIALVLLLCPLVSAEDFVDRPTGLVLKVPGGWDRDTAREKGSVRFAGIYSLARDRFVTFVIEAVPANGFSADDWLSNEKRIKTTRYLGEVDQAFARSNDARVGGHDAVGYTLGGIQKRKQGGKAQAKVHFRVAGVINADTFFQITEVSYNGAYTEIADKLREIWDGISFQAAEGDEAGQGGAAADPAGKPASYTDAKGNYKLTVPAGWEVAREAPDDPEAQARMQLVRKDSDDDTVMILRVYRFRGNPDSLFTSWTPTKAVETGLLRQIKLFDSFYGQGAGQRIQPDISEGNSLGGNKRAADFELRSRTLDELKRIEEAEALARRGDKNAKVPDIKPMVIRGRLAMLAPHLYIVMAEWSRSLSDDEKLVAEYRSILDSFEFLSSQARPSPRSFQSRGGGTAFTVGNTLDDPALAKDRKTTTIKVDKGTKVHRIQWNFIVPKGFLDVKEKLKMKGPSIFLVAQDKNNAWVEIQVINASFKALSEQVTGNTIKRMQEKKAVAAGWKSNWEGKARGAKFPSKPQKFKLGRVKGEGYKHLTGTVNKFPSTFAAIVSDKSSWRTIITIETLAGGDKIFADGIKLFLKSLKFKPLKK